MAETSFKVAMKEAKSSIGKILFIDTFLESLIIFLIAYLIVSVAGFLDKTTMFITIGIGIGYFILKTIKNMLIDKVELIGEQYPQLYEELLTARENRPGKNQVITDLHSEAVIHMRAIEESAFFSPKPTTYKTIAVVVLCLLVLLLAPINIKESPAVKKAVDAIAKTKVSLSFAKPQEIQGGGPSGSGTVESKGDIFGKKRTVEEGIKASKINVATSNFEVNLNQEEQPGDNFKFDSVFPSEIGTPDPTLYAESIPKDQQELVKSYFRISAEG
ncbi:MAG: hypothetical protein EPN86_05810 [Nanoarchaeota archaeon]|nr:MAG: hypothetical protein EPN86_05810 [Nanoarchaeota archaeon]